MPPTRHVYETYIRTTPEQLWAALVDPDLTRRYFYRCAFTGDVSPGSPYAFVGPGGETAVDGAIEEAEPFRRLVMTFHIAFDEVAAAEKPSRVTWEITPLGEVCRLTLLHQDLYGAPRTRQITATGWPPLVLGPQDVARDRRGAARGARRPGRSRRGRPSTVALHREPRASTPTRRRGRCSARASHGRRTRTSG